MTLISQIDQIITQKSLLKHPFYEAWSAGTLSLDSLAGYSQEYFQLVKSIPKFMDDIMTKAPDYILDELVANRQEESDHIQPWIDFAGALGVSEVDLMTYEGLPKTRQAVSDLGILMTDIFEVGACAMYSLEKEIPKISQTKLDGLAEFYDISSTKATEYFRLHTEADIRHAASWQSLIKNNSHDLLDVAHLSVSAQNLLLDACYDEYCNHRS